MSDRILFAKLSKIDEEKRLVYGRAVEEVEDRAGETFDYASSKPLFEEWSKSQSDASMGKSMGNVREMHGSEAAGILVPGAGLTFNDAEKAIDVCAHVVDDNAWNKVLKGVYTGFSIGGKYVRKWKDDTVTRYTAGPSELSLVDRPCGPTSTFFDVIKADGIVEKREFVKFNRRGAVNELLQKGVIVTELINKSDDEVKDMLDEKIIEATVVEKAEDAAQPDLEVDGSDEEVIAFAKLLKDAKLKMGDVLKIVGAHVVAKDAKPHFGAILFADTVNKRFPLDTVEQLKAAGIHLMRADEAVQKIITDALHKAKIEVPALDKAKAERLGTMIKAAGIDVAKLQDGDEAKIAQLTKDDNTKQFRKGMYACANFSRVIADLISLGQSVEYEAMVEDDNSPMGGKINDAVKVLGALLVEMVQEEVAEATSKGDTVDVEAPIMVLADAAKDMVKRLDGLKVATPTVAKAGARNSKADQDKIQAMHDHAKDLGAACDAGDSKKMDMASAVDFLKGLGIEKPTDEQVKKVLEVPAGALAKSDTTVDVQLTKSLQASVETLQKKFDDQEIEMKKLQDDNKILKAQPARTSIKLRAVAKGQEIGDSTEVEVTPIKKSDGSVDEFATAVKLAQSTGGSLYLGDTKTS